MAVRIKFECNSRDCTKQIKKLNKEIDLTNQTGKDVSKPSGGLGQLKSGWKTMLPAVVAVTAAIATAKKVFDMSKEGASIIQTRNSWNGLLSTLGASPSILNDISKASNGTVSELDVMQSTTVLLMGTSKELGSAMADNASKLMEIAKASHKLNPALGSTQFLYESLSKGVKRNSPLMIDNSGVLVSSTTANEAYAKSLGKTVKALTEEEKKIALLIQTVKNGEEIIKQAAASSDDMTDSYEQLSVVTKELADDFKVRLAEALIPTVQWFADVATAAMDTSDAIEAHGWTLTHYGIVVDESGEKVEDWQEIIENTPAVIEDAGTAVSGLVLNLEYMATATEEAGSAAEGVGEAYTTMWSKTVPNINDMVEAWQKYLDWQASNGPAMVAYMEGYSLAVAAGTVPIEEQRTTLELLAIMSGQNRIAMGEDAKAVAKDLGIPLAVLKDTNVTLTDLPDYKKVTVDVITRHYNEWYGTTGVEEHALGGPLDKGVHTVGEAGWEYVINGVVIPHDQSKKLKELGLGSQGGFQGGSPDPFGGWGGVGGWYGAEGERGSGFWGRLDAANVLDKHLDKLGAVGRFAQSFLGNLIDPLFDSHVHGIGTFIPSRASAIDPYKSGKWAYGGSGGGWNFLPSLGTTSGAYDFMQGTSIGEGGGRGTLPGGRPAYTGIGSSLPMMQMAMNKSSEQSAQALASMQMQTITGVAQAVQSSMATTVLPETTKQTRAITAGSFSQLHKTEELIMLTRQMLDTLQDQPTTSEMRSMQEDTIRTTGY